MTGHPETAFHVSVIEFLKIAAPALVALHIPNGELRTKQAGRRLKRMGVVAGAPDLMVLAPGGRVYFLECKSGRGRLSAAQQDFERVLIKLGFAYGVVKSLDQVEAFLRQHNLPHRLATRSRLASIEGRAHA